MHSLYAETTFSPPDDANDFEVSKSSSRKKKSVLNDLFSSDDEQKIVFDEGMYQFYT